MLGVQTAAKDSRADEVDMRLCKVVHTLAGKEDEKGGEVRGGIVQFCEHRTG